MSEQENDQNRDRVINTEQMSRTNKWMENEWTVSLDTAKLSIVQDHGDVGCGLAW